MNSYIQLVVIIVSFLYGFLLYYLNKLQKKLLMNKNIVSKIIIIGLYCNVIALIYILFLFKINGGLLHIYFILCFLVGYCIASVKKRK